MEKMNGRVHEWVMSQTLKWKGWRVEAKTYVHVICKPLEEACGPVRWSREGCEITGLMLTPSVLKV